MAIKKSPRPKSRSETPQTNPLADKTPAAKPAATPAALHQDDPDPAWQTAHDTLQSALDTGNQLLDQIHDPDQRSTLNDTLDILSSELTALDQEDMQNRTITLQAAAQQLGGGIAQLKILQQQLAQIAKTISAAASTVDKVTAAISGVESFLSTFGAL